MSPGSERQDVLGPLSTADCHPSPNTLYQSYLFETVKSNFTEIIYHWWISDDQIMRSNTKPLVWQKTVLVLAGQSFGFVQKEWVIWKEFTSQTTVLLILSTGNCLLGPYIFKLKGKYHDLLDSQITKFLSFCISAMAFEWIAYKTKILFTWLWKVSLQNVLNIFYIW